MSRIQQTRSTDRTEQEAQRRRARANQHLDRLRNGAASGRRRKLPVPRGAWMIGALGLALVTGAWIGDDALALGGAGGSVGDRGAGQHAPLRDRGGARGGHLGRRRLCRRGPAPPAGSLRQRLDRRGRRGADAPGTVCCACANASRSR